MKAAFFAALLSCALAAPAAAQLSAEAIDANARRTVETLELTGMAITVVTADETLFTGTYGVREVGADAPVDADTLFPFGSIGKAFTTAALAMLVDEGRLKWDDPVRKYIPEFEMSDPYITNEFTVRDLLTHRSGLPLGAGDLLFVPDAAPDTASILAAMRTIPPETSFRSQFAYDNLLYILGGEVSARIEGRPWADIIHTRIFEPLGMSSCKARPSEAAAAANTVTQHARPPGGAAEPLHPRYIFADNSGPAGAMSCSISDLGKWAMFWLNGAKTPSGKALLSPEQAREVWTGVTPTRARGDLARFAGANFSLYALGWSLNDFHGELMVSHGGAVLGGVAYFAILPKKNIAVFVAANDYVPGLGSLALQILAAYAAPDADHDWIASAGAAYRQYRENSARDSGAGGKPPKPAKLQRPLAAYVGVYDDPWYGEATVSIADGALFLDMGRSEALDAPLIPVGPDKFLARWPDRTLNADGYVTFAVEGGRVAGMTMKAVSATTDFSFDFHHLAFRRRE